MLIVVQPLDIKKSRDLFRSLSNCLIFFSSTILSTSGIRISSLERLFSLFVVLRLTPLDHVPFFLSGVCDATELFNFDSGTGDLAKMV